MLVGAVLTAPPLQAETGSCPPFVRPGLWELTHAPGIRTSAGFFVGGKGKKTVEVFGERHGEQISVADGNRSLVLHRREGTRYATEPEVHSERNVTMKITYAMSVSSPELMEVDLEISGLAGGFPAGGKRAITFRFKADAPARQAECECKGLDEYLAERVDSNEKLRDLYGNPRYQERPPAFPADMNWEAEEYELLINQMAKGNTYADAVQAVLDQTRASDSGAGDPGNCFRWIYFDELSHHMSLHSTRCVAMKAEPRTWSDNMNIPRELGLEEARAYQATIEWLERWKADHCRK